LGDIPAVGNFLFSAKDSHEETTQLIIFIKSIIVSNTVSKNAFSQQTLDGSELQPKLRRFEERVPRVAGQNYPVQTLVLFDSRKVLDLRIKSPKNGRMDVFGEKEIKSMLHP
jgi:hypothetical protein